MSQTEVLSALESAFSDVFALGEVTSQRLRTIVQELQVTGISPPMNDDSIKRFADRYFPALVASYKDTKHRRDYQKRQFGETDARYQELKRLTETNCSILDDAKLLLRATLVLMFYHYPQCTNLKTSDVNVLLQQYKENPLFEAVQLPSVEASLLLTFRNYLRVGFALFPEKRNKRTLMRIAARLEGRQAEYIMGSGATVETRRRLAIFDNESALLQLQLQHTLNPNPRRRSLRSYVSLVRAVREAVVRFRRGGAELNRRNAVLKPLRRAVQLIKLTKRLERDARFTSLMNAIQLLRDSGIVDVDLNLDLTGEFGGLSTSRVSSSGSSSSDSLVDNSVDSELDIASLPEIEEFLTNFDIAEMGELLP